LQCVGSTRSEWNIDSIPGGLGGGFNRSAAGQNDEIGKGDFFTVLL
jgi:hypothetical protein